MDYLEEILVTSAAIEDLLDENPLIWVLKLSQKLVFLVRIAYQSDVVVGVGVNSLDDWVEILDALGAMLNQLRELHLNNL